MIGRVAKKEQDTAQHFAQEKRILAEQLDIAAKQCEEDRDHAHLMLKQQEETAKLQIQERDNQLVKIAKKNEREKKWVKTKN